MEIAITQGTTADGRPKLDVAGALDLQSRQALVQAGTAWLAEVADAPLIIGLAGVNFMDSTGIGALVELAGEAQDAERGFIIVNPSARATRILQITGLLDTWTVEVDTAVG